MIKSRYKLLQLIVVLLFSALFLVAPFFILNSGNHVKAKPLLFILPLLGAFMFYTFFQKTPRISFDNEFISVKYLFDSKTYDWLSIKNIFLSKKEYNWGQSLEATVIVFDNGDKLRLWEDMYSNCDQMRSMISRTAGEKIRDPRPGIITNNLRFISRKRYSGNVYTSFNTLMIVGIAIFFAVLLKDSLKADLFLLLPVGFILFFFMVLGTQMNYFIIDEDILFVKNHYFPWIAKQIELKDIAEVNIETPYKRSTGLRIITKNFNSKIYGAGSLRNKNWQDLLNDLKFIGIPGRDDR